MDQRVFDQIDRLERGSRFSTRPSQHALSDDSHPAHDGPRVGHDQLPRYDDQYQYGQEDFDTGPMVLDAFDEQLLRRADHNTRQGQATMGRARLSLPPGSAYEAPHDFDYGQPVSQINGDAFGPGRFDLSQYAFNTGHPDQQSSPRMVSEMPSSPAYRASQQRQTATEYQRPNRGTNSRRLAGESMQASQYQARSINELAADDRNVSNEGPLQRFQPDFRPPRPARKSNLPVVQGIALVSTHNLPDRFRAIFPYPLFNAVQSKTFDTIYKMNNNFVLSAPTGSGKTAVLELAICHLMNGFTKGSYKIIYQAPTRALCAERQRDWQAKFGPLDLQCAELTGDTDNAHLRHVESATIIITTPEKWDSMTRKWTDHQRLMQMIKLFLIDEVHMLKEDRGATLEAVVSRMKSVGSDVRFVALSATVPNSQDIATWLGQDSMNTHLPATRERFGEEFRPVKLQKHVCGYQGGSNDFAFEQALNSKLPDVIAKWSQRKPMMVFCFTRAACVATAKLLADWWATSPPRDRYWSAARSQVIVIEKDLQETIKSGVAYHHAGLSIQDRSAVEKGYLNGDINVICCTSTLAVGVNLPCHMVIIKNTVAFQGPTAGCKEYSDIEVMQMLGRAGRPQFDDSAVAVIMTRLTRVQHYEKMITGQEVLESCLHRNLIDHLNAEIGLGTITSAAAAKKWLTGTFLYVRLKENPMHYKIDGDASSNNLDQRLENICSKGIKLLTENDLVKSAPNLRCTEYGDAMARYYVQFDTMKLILALPRQAKVSEILSTVSQAAEFKDIRFRAGEKSTYKDLNKNTSIKFPIPVNLEAASHKVSLIIQSVLGAIDFPTEDTKQRAEFTSAKAIIFQQVQRLIRCIVDCQLHLEDAVATQNALMLARSLGAQVWDDSPLHLNQLEGVGPITVRKLVAAGIQSMEELENTETHRIEQLLSRYPPCGRDLQAKAKAFPKLRVTLKMMGGPAIEPGQHVTIKLQAEIGFLNDKVPDVFQRKAVYVCLLAATSDGQKVHFARISAKKLNKGQDVLFSANLTSANQSIRVYVMCDGIAGTLKSAVLKPQIPAVAFPPPKKVEDNSQSGTKVLNAANTSKRWTSNEEPLSVIDEFDEHIDDEDLVRAGLQGFVDIDDFDDSGNQNNGPKQKGSKTSTTAITAEDREPRKLPNGKWACNHACSDKTTCKHFCCREGCDKKPKPPKSKAKQPETEVDSKQTKLNMSVAKKSTGSASMVSSNKVANTPTAKKANASKEASDLDKLHKSIKTKTPIVPTLSRIPAKDDAGPTRAQSKKPISFLEAAREFEDEQASTHYGTEDWNASDLSTMSNFQSRMSPPQDHTETYNAEEEMLDEYDMNMSTDHAPYSSVEDQEAGNALELSDAIFENFATQPFATKPKTSSEGVKTNTLHDTPFLGHSTDSAVEDGSLQQMSDFQSQSRKHGLEPATSKFFSAAKKRKTSSAAPIQIHDDSQDQAPALPQEQAKDPDAIDKWFQTDFDTNLSDDTFLAQVPEATTAEPAPTDEQRDGPDELEKWFNANFGDKLFNYIG